MMTPTRGINLVSPPPILAAITPPRPASPDLSDADSECLDNGSNSPSSFTGEECPDLCGGPKNSCRSWTPPASPFYYTDERGIFLLDDRQGYEERQKIELALNLRDLDARLQRLEKTTSPPRYCSNRSAGFETRTPSSRNGHPHRSTNEASPPPPPQGPPNHPHLPPAPHQTRDRDSHHKHLPPNPNHQPQPPDLTSLIRTSLQRVSSTHSPPRCLHPAPLPPAEQTGYPTPHRDDGHVAPRSRSKRRLHVGTTAYPTPLPSSPESVKPGRKRGRGREREGEGEGCKRGCWGG